MDTIEKIRTLYAEGFSVYRISRDTGMSREKVKKILIDMGIFTPKSEATQTILDLLKSGLTVKEVAERLCLTEKHVWRYVPYQKGMYKKDNPTKEVLKQRRFWERQKAKKQEGIQ